MTSQILKFVGPTHNSNGEESANAYHHRKALSGSGGDQAKALKMMLEGWELYAKAHKERFEDNIGNDYVIGDYWANAGLAIKRLLDGETGGLDCGSIAHNISEAITAEGIEHDGYVLLTKSDD